LHNKKNHCCYCPQRTIREQHDQAALINRNSTFTFRPYQTVPYMSNVLPA